METIHSHHAYWKNSVSALLINFKYVEENLEKGILIEHTDTDMDTLFNFIP